MESTAIKAIAVFDIDGVVRDVGGSYRRAIADTVEHFTAGTYRPAVADIDVLKSEGIWNNDWQASQELVYRYFESQGQSRQEITLDYETLVAFFQSRYRGPDSKIMTGYICQEPVLIKPAYFTSLSQAGILWGFFSGAMRDECAYVLEGSLGLKKPVVIAMEDAPSKPDPTGLFAAVEQLEQKHNCTAKVPVFYAGDTVADMYVIREARQLRGDRSWQAVGVLPPHVLETPERRDSYSATLIQAGAATVLNGMQELTPEFINKLLANRDRSLSL